MKLMDLALAEVGLLNSPIEEEDRVALSLQLGVLLQNSVLQGAGLCRGCLGGVIVVLPLSFERPLWNVTL